ncbi:MFS transporter [Lapillicoccus jejuensis]|uniref:EmrB/QacA subfamily drug resistance transporter n=1 Tax=Lapillicoccus jejuensis TaxID=402171 RepID=A0A542E0R4_9MICO|nr:MFS transporter [Lapillicoccus jejuensis]TQJ08916.1 EmrB/QacA subfamily drug resistance transporter [Lapillicoccus jejuensis]
MTSLAYDAPPTPAAAAPDLPTGRARTLALVALLLASAMELLDVTIVNVALPSIERGLGASAVQLQWMVAAYPLAFAVALVTGSRLGDRFGRRRLFIVGLVAFTLMSAACGLAPGASELVVFRALQGLGAAAMIPQVLTCIQVLYPLAERAAAMGVFTALAGVTSVLGPVVGAVLTTVDVAGLGWRSIFLVNVPVGVVALLAALRLVPESRSERRPGLTPVAVLALAGTLLAILLPLTVGREHGWPVGGFVVMAAGLVALAALVRRQLHLAATGREPLVALGLYRVRSFAAGSLVHAMLFVAMSATFLCQTVYLQAGLGWSVLHAGLAALPYAVTTSLAAGLGMAVLVPRIGPRVLQLGALVWAVGTLAMVATVHLAGAGASTWVFVPAFVLSGAGFGLLVAPVGMFTIADVPVADAGSASGLLGTTGQLGSAVGAAVVGTLFFSVAVAQRATTPYGALAPAFEVVLLVLVGLLVVVAVAAGRLPRTAPTA